jgi:glycerophosphoryl diester phosphodiesterase
MLLKKIGVKRGVALSLVAFGAFLYLNNTSRLAAPLEGGPVLIAHRALGQDYDRTGLTSQTCTAEHWISPGHEYLENTIPAIRAAFDCGADWVEFDVQKTADGGFAVFHDWTLDCRTDGAGVTREHTLAELKALDIGYGYTADGVTYPFRGKGIGLMPSLDEVLKAFPEGSFILDVKSNDPEEGELLAERLAALPRERQEAIMVFGGTESVAPIRERLPHIRTTTRPQLKRCLIRYMLVGWTGFVPGDAENTVLTIPANIAPWLWGWPNRFLQRMAKANSMVVLLGDYGGEGFSTPFDDPSQLEDIDPAYAGGIWTDRIDLIAPAVRNGAHFVAYLRE